MVPRHTDRLYDKELQDLREQLLAMGGRVEAQLASSVRAVSCSRTISSRGTPTRSAAWRLTGMVA